MGVGCVGGGKMSRPDGAGGPLATQQFPLLPHRGPAEAGLFIALATGINCLTCVTSLWPRRQPWGNSLSRTPFYKSPN